MEYAEGRTHKRVKVEPAHGIKLQGAFTVKTFSPGLLLDALASPLLLSRDYFTCPAVGGSSSDSIRLA